MTCPQTYNDAGAGDGGLSTYNGGAQYDAGSQYDGTAAFYESALAYEAGLLYESDKLPGGQAYNSPYPYNGCVEAEDERRYYGGRGRHRGRKEPDPEEQLHRDHWDYMDSLREIQAKAAQDQIQITTSPAVVGRAMRGKVKVLEQPQAAPVGANGIVGNPILLAALVALIDDE